MCIMKNHKVKLAMGKRAPKSFLKVVGSTIVLPFFFGKFVLGPMVEVLFFEAKTRPKDTKV